MIRAIVNGKEVEAFLKGRGKCPMCDEPVFAKCGELKRFHWSHFKSSDCSNWTEPETEWHYHWKMTFGESNNEITIKKNGRKHRADIQTKNKIVIEVQNSPISRTQIRQREEFYGEQMIWVLNGNEFKNRFKVIESNHELWKESEYTNDWDEEKCEPVIIKNNVPQPEIGFKDFEWENSKQSWSCAQRTVYIDFGETELFLVRHGMGSSLGNGDWVSKEKFINEHGGDFIYYNRNYPFNFQ